MLDLDKIYTDFKALINQFDSDYLDSWIEFDNNRLMLSKLLSGETVSWSIESFAEKSPNVISSHGYKDSFCDNYTYRMAA